MKVLFLQFGTKYYKHNNDYYTDGSLNENVWKRYMKYSNPLTVLGKKCSIEHKNIDVKNLNSIPEDINLILLDDIYNPKKNYLNFKLRNKIKKIIKNKIDENDRIIIRSVTNDYNIFAAKYCLKKGKQFIIEVTGFAFDSLWYHDGILGKIMALIVEYKMKKIIRKSPNVLYVTDSSLQKRYPNCYKNVGCSDVEIDLDDDVFKLKEKKYEDNFDIKNAIIGTIGPINSKLKGQESVIKALSKYNKINHCDIKYELVGRGNKDYLLSIARKYNFEKNIIFVGEISHNKIFEWLDHIDIYIQPSFQEGLCRAIVEAMSRGCVVFASNAGGNTELVSEKYIFRKGKSSEIIKILGLFKKDDITNILRDEYEVVKKYERKKLEKIRNNFYDNFFKDDKGGKL